MVDDGRLLTVLTESRARGFLGPGPVEPHLHHARLVADLLLRHVGAEPGVSAVDLGSGGGVPGLLLAAALPRWRWCLLDANERRTAFLREAVDTLGVSNVRVWRERAEIAGREARARGSQQVVVARSFGPPAVTAECGAPLLAVGGLLVVSEPPESRPDRWPAEGLVELGLDPVPVVAGPWIGFRQDVLAPERFPRAVGRPAKRPLWRST